jgi:hypothetical protein
MRTAVLAVMAAILLATACSDGGKATASGPPVPTAASLVPGAEALVCRAPIDSLAAPPAEFETVAGVVALETARTLPSEPSGELDPARALFAKTGLLIRAGAQFELIVPDEWVGRLGLRWGNVGGEPITEHLQITGCRTGSGADWLVYPGGFYVAAPACVPVIVKSGTGSRTVAVSVGAPCPSVPA